MDRYGLASGKNFNTIADRALDASVEECYHLIRESLLPRLCMERPKGRELVNAVRRLVRAALDVERQRAFERGIEAFAAMPMVRERNVTSGPGFWTGD